jgi:hypothetical protein
MEAHLQQMKLQSDSKLSKHRDGESPEKSERSSGKKKHKSSKASRHDRLLQQQT